MEKWHKAKGWSQIGYTRVIDNVGTVYDGRRRQVTQAHAKGYNRNGIGLCVTGDNTVSGREWTPTQHTQLYDELIYWVRLFPFARVAGHRDLKGAQTLCPGIEMQEWLEHRDLIVPTIAWTNERITEEFGDGT